VRQTKWRVIVRKTIRVKSVKFTFNGEKAPFERTKTKGGRRMFLVSIDMRGLAKGTYVARVKYQVVGRPTKFDRRKVHYYRTCGGKDSLNAYPVTVL
jgi:hypothetical protein